jgi:hypothetical protein
MVPLPNLPSGPNNAAQEIQTNTIATLPGLGEMATSGDQLPRPLLVVYGTKGLMSCRFEPQDVAVPDTPEASAVYAQFLTAAIRREMIRRTAIKPVTRTTSKGIKGWIAIISWAANGDRATAVLAAAGYSLSLLLRWLRLLLRRLLRLLITRRQLITT